MRVVIVTGDRNATNQPRERRQWRQVVAEVLGAVRADMAADEPAILIHGACGLDADRPGQGAMRGIDAIAAEVGDELGFMVMPVPAHWTRYQRSAGPMRNREMVKRAKQLEAAGADVLTLAFHDAFTFSSGTRNCVNESFRAGIRSRIFDLAGNVRSI